MPTLILVGDRDDFCSVEEAAVAFRNLGHGQLAVLRNIGHVISTGKIRGTSQLPDQPDRATSGEEQPSEDCLPARQGRPVSRVPPRSLGPCLG